MSAHPALLRRAVPALVGLIIALGAVPAAAVNYAPLDQPGPSLSPSAAQLRESLRCHGDLEGSKIEPVLLLSATTVNSEENFASGLQKSLTAAGIPWCTSDQPGTLNHNMDDIQLRGEYVTYAIREVARRARRPIAVAGHSQGGMVMRWSLRFWPDTRRKVADVIGIAGSNHGSTTIQAQCMAGCSAAFAQQAKGSMFEDALNSGQETFAGISYTEISTNNDEIVTPGGRDGASSVNGPGRITNVAVQDLCPGDVREHLAVHVDPVTWALLLDAITFNGPAGVTRIPSSVCEENYPPGVDPATLPTDLANTYAVVTTQIATYPHAPEPPLRCYVTASCGTPATTRGKACSQARDIKLRVRGRGKLRRVRVTVNGRRVPANRRARTVRPDLSAFSGRHVRVRVIAGFAGGRRRTSTRVLRICP